MSSNCSKGFSGTAMCSHRMRKIDVDRAGSGIFVGRSFEWMLRLLALLIRDFGLLANDFMARCSFMTGSDFFQ